MELRTHRVSQLLWVTICFAPWPLHVLEHHLFLHNYLALMLVTIYNNIVPKFLKQHLTYNIPLRGTHTLVYN